MIQLHKVIQFNCYIKLCHLNNETRVTLGLLRASEPWDIWMQPFSTTLRPNTNCRLASRTAQMALQSVVKWKTQASNNTHQIILFVLHRHCVIVWIWWTFLWYMWGQIRTITCLTSFESIITMLEKTSDDKPQMIMTKKQNKKTKTMIIKKFSM